MSKLLSTRVQCLILTTAGQKPTIPVPATLTPEDTGWKATDIMKAEWAWNAPDDKWYYRTNVDEIKEFQGGGGGIVFSPVADLTALKAIDTTNALDYPDKGLIHVETEGIFALDRDSAATADDNFVVAPTTGVGRWIRETLPPDSLLSTSDLDVSDINEGEQKILTVKKEGGVGVVGEAVLQVDKLVSASFDTLLADTADWVGDEITLTGDNLTGALGQNSQEHQMNGQFYLCVSHNFGTDATNGSATWVRNRSNDAIQPATNAHDGLVADQLDPSRTAGNIDDGWNLTTDTKVITVRSKVGSWWASTSGYTYFCYAESGTNWYWKRVGKPSAVFIQITDATLIAEIEAHDFATTPILQPVATEKGVDRQEHYWETNTGTTPNLAKCIDDGGTKKWIKIL